MKKSIDDPFFRGDDDNAGAEAWQILPDSLNSDNVASSESQLFLHYALEENQTVRIDTSRPIHDRQEALAVGLPAVDVLAVVQLSENDELMVVDSREDYSKPIAIINPQALGIGFQKLPDPQQLGIKGLGLGETVRIGREEDSAGRLGLSRKNDEVSRHHCLISLSQDGQLTVSNLEPLNGTSVSGWLMVDPNEIEPVVADYTSRVVADFDQRGWLSIDDQERPTVYGRAIIGRNSKTVKDSIYATRNSEMILVDDKTPIVKQTVEEALQLVAETGQARLTLRDKLTLMNQAVFLTMRYDLSAVNQVCDAKRGQIVPLSQFIQQGIGVCRQQALLAALILEEAVTRGVLPDGEVHVERNVDMQVTPDGSGHAWAIYRPKDGKDFVVDPAMKITGTRKEAGAKTKWRHYLPGQDE
jgi:hypothetical protein